MRKFISVLALVLSLMGAFAHPQRALASEGKKVEKKNAVLVVAFGSSMPEGQRAIDAVFRSVKDAFPGTEVRLSFTSRIIMRKLAKEGKVFLDPITSLAKLHEEGYTNVAVLSTHVIPGEEYDDLSAVVGAFRYLREHGSKSGFEGIALSKPLLWSPEDYERVSAILGRAFGKDPRRGVVLMGHGSPHPAEGAYARLQTVLQRKHPNFVVGTVEGTPSLEDVISQLKGKGIKRAILAPLMLVAGDHAHNDMAGDEEDSWINVLSKEGIKAEAHLKGLGENPEIRALLVEHLKEAAEEAGF
ncbi:cobalamin biosynthesis protein CbiK, Co2+ chelatase [Thermanaerovibrio velox DSM 12556]|uniref:Cobalamin biosynthesis protein CbiK, Co2+ chelatase n=2 Tax=Thermanaerovibrio TaxID=81461 RepID=H0UMW7_9BACT|nr:cobalamin biosynthesis protein CbiK, Co2+ chelatase [Thermanaerovibrio velox DSM 12556]